MGRWPIRIRRIAILIDGGFFIKRLRKVTEQKYHDSPQAIAESARFLCKRHVQQLVGEPENIKESRWLDHVYRLFYYDARPYGGVAHHPITNRRIEFEKTDQAQFREELFQELRKKRKFALRLGKVTREADWQILPGITKQLLKTKNWLSLLEEPLKQEQNVIPSALDVAKRKELEKLVATWKSLDETNVSLGLRQKGVDMRIGLDIASITLKKQADTIVLVTGDSDFVPAAKLARREGIEFILDPLWQRVSYDLFEHIDGLHSGFPPPQDQEETSNNGSEP